MQLGVGVATGIGSLPGTDPAEATRMVFGELPDLPHLPELPERGPGADMVGRAAGLLVDLAVDLQPAGWRLVPHPGHDLRRARGFLEHDLDALEEIAEGYEGWLKVQVTGPWTLAAAVELPRGGRVLGDPGAVRDLQGSLLEGLRVHLAGLRRRVPGARLLVQLDEPALPAVLAGTIPTASGFGALGAVESATVQAAVAAIVDGAVDPVVVHCCAADPPIDLLRRAGAAGLALDAALLPADDALGTAVEAGTTLLLGSTDSTVDSTVDETADVARRLWRRLGFPPHELAGAVVVTPSCGLAAAGSPARARRILAGVRQAAARLVEAPEPAGPVAGH